jgi:hypothetical protein
MHEDSTGRMIMTEDSAFDGLDNESSCEMTPREHIVPENDFWYVDLNDESRDDELMERDDNDDDDNDEKAPPNEKKEEKWVDALFEHDDDDPPPLLF